MTGNVSSPGIGSCWPSAIVRGTSIRTRSPAASERTKSSPASGSTPITRVSGESAVTAVAQPASRPPPPRQTSRTSSGPRVLEQLERRRALAGHHALRRRTGAPGPARAPRPARRAAPRGPARSGRRARSRRRSRAVAASLPGRRVVGHQDHRRAPRAAARRARAPARGCRRRRSRRRARARRAPSRRPRCNAPRNLNAPTRCRFSAFSRTRAAPVASSSERPVMTGVRCATPSSRPAAAWTSSSVITARESRMPRASCEPPASPALDSALQLSPLRRATSRRPWRAKAGTTSSGSSPSRPEMIRRSGTRCEVRRDLEQQRADEVGEHGRRVRAALADVAARDLERRRRWPPRPRASPRPTRARRRRPAPAPSRASRPRSRARRCRSPSRRARPSGSSSASSSSVRRVVACEPVPNAWPGLDDDVERARRAAAPTAAGPAAAAGTSIGRVEAAPVLAPVVGQLGRRDVDQRARRPPRARRRASGSSPARAVEHVLDVLAGLALLQPAGREHHQLGQHELGVLALDAHGQPDHARSSTSAAQPSSSRRSRSTNPCAAQAAAARRPAPARTPEAISVDVRRPAGRATRRASSSGSVRFATTVGAHGAVRVTSPTAHLDRRPRWRGVARARRTRPPRPARRATTGAKPSRAAAIASTPLPQPQSASAVARQLLQQLQAQPRRRVRGGAEAQARVDHEVVGAPGDPRRADRDRADDHAAPGARARRAPSRRRPARRVTPSSVSPASARSSASDGSASP